MSHGERTRMVRRTPPPRPPAARRRDDGIPPWMLFLIVTALVFGAFYLWQGAQNFIRTGGLGVEEATRRAEIISTATTERLATRPATRAVTTPLAAATAIPDCTEFRVIVPNAIVRQLPSTNSPIVTGLVEGTGVCVLGQDEGSEWYTVDGNPDTRRREIAYMHETVIEAVNPTPTATITPTPLPTVTPLPTNTATLSPTPPPTDTPGRAPSRTPSSTPSATPSATETLPPLQNA